MRRVLPFLLALARGLGFGQQLLLGGQLLALAAVAALTAGALAATAAFAASALAAFAAVISGSAHGSIPSLELPLREQRSLVATKSR